MQNLNPSKMKMEWRMKFLLQRHLNKIGLLKERIVLFKKWLGWCSSTRISLISFWEKSWTHRVILEIKFSFKRVPNKSHMKYGMKKSLKSNICGYFVASALFSMIYKILKSLMPRVMKEFSFGTPWIAGCIKCSIKNQDSYGINQCCHRWCYPGNDCWWKWWCYKS